jgi:hypothetical protein
MFSRRSGADLDPARTSSSPVLRRIAMKRSSLTVFATMALALGLSAPASAATADPHASCAGLVGPYYAGQAPGTHAEVTLGVVAEFLNAEVAPGANFSDFASFHDQTAEVCLA